MIKNFLNPKGHQNPTSGLKVKAILLKVWILPNGGVASGRVCACSLRSRLVSIVSEKDKGEGFEQTLRKVVNAISIPFYKYIFV